MRTYTCGFCGTTFRGNASDNDVGCPACGAIWCPHESHWLGAS